MNIRNCFSCGGGFPKMDGPIHPYMTSSPGCWAIYSEVLAREYENPTYFEVHRLTVDAYAVQHPGSKDRQSIQSVGVHLIRLNLLLNHDLRPEEANNAMLKAAKSKHTFCYLTPPSDPGAITAADVHKARSVNEHMQLVKDWAHCTWQAWSEHHHTVRRWTPHEYL